MSVKSKQSSRKSSSGKKEKKKKIEDSDEDFESSEEELDLTKECHPIGYYIHDRAEMINQMFSVIKGNKLKAMLPPILKDCDIEQLKLQCLDQLLGMSEKRITCLLEGETLETSSESEIIESDECDSDEKNGTSGSNSDRSDDSQDDFHSKNMENLHKKRKGDYINEVKSGKLSKSESEPQEQGKTLLEILELEMRARAIRALLKQSGNEKGSDAVSEEPKNEVNGVKQISDEVVDLTECEDEEFPPTMKKEKVESKDSDMKVSNFDEKIDQSTVEKPNPQGNEKLKKLQAELELRNKVFKKKIYRTRQQRMENEEEEHNIEKSEGKGINPSGSEEVLIKQETVEPQESVMEDPEEGEINTSEDEHSMGTEKELPKAVEGKNDFEAKIDNDSVRVSSISNGTFFSNNNSENIVVQQEEKEDLVVETEVSESVESQNQIQQIKPQITEEESDTIIEETSWRDRWFQKDGVQKLVKSSKIFAKVKKRIAEKSQKAKEEVPSPYDVNSDSNSNSKPETIIGSIEEYERLLNRNQEEKKDDLGKSGNSVQVGKSESVTEMPEVENTQKT